MPVAGMRFDFGGIVKEYAADRAAACCRSAAVVHGVVDLGGDLAVVGPHHDGQAWLAGIKLPSDPRRACASIAIARGGLATSGDYERVLVIAGKRYSHIVDPRSGWPIESFASVSVIADSCLVAGAASTLAMLLGPREGAAYLQGLALPHLCIDQAGRTSGSIAVD
jgi:thiamine biosynthesis lipoprotein